MEVHIVESANAPLYADEIEQDHLHRHRVFVEEKGWESLRRSDGREIDQYDTAGTTRLLLLKAGEVGGGLRLTPLTQSTLLLDHFAHLVQRPLPDALDRGADWTRFYLAGKRPERLGPSSAAAALYCAAMELALLRDWSYLTFVSKPAMLEILVSIGWRVTPLGMPQLVGGELTIAAWIEVDARSLTAVQAVTGHARSLLRQRGMSEAAFGTQLHRGQWVH